MSTLMAEARKEAVLAVLAEIGGWLSAGAIWNRIEVSCSKAQVDSVLAELVGDGEVREIHGLTTAEYALAGVALPDDCRQAVRPRQLNADGYEPAEAHVGRVTVPAQLAPPPTPRATGKFRQAVYTREDAKTRILELLAGGMNYTVTELAKLMGSHGGAVLGAVYELLAQEKVERLGKAGANRYRLMEPGAKPEQPLPSRREAPALRKPLAKPPAAAQAPRKAAAPPAPPPAALQGAKAPAAAPAKAGTRFALCDDGELIIRRLAGDDFVLDQAETRNLFAFVRRMTELDAAPKATA